MSTICRDSEKWILHIDLRAKAIGVVVSGAKQSSEFANGVRTLTNELSVGGSGEMYTRDGPI